MWNNPRSVKIPKERLYRRSEAVGRGRLLDAATAPCARLRRRKKRRQGFMRYLIHIATVANVVRPVREQEDVPAVLGDGAFRATVGFELDEEFGEGFFDLHGGLLGILTLNSSHCALSADAWGHCVAK